MLRLALLFAFFTSSFAWSQESTDWPQFRGPTSNGVSPAKGLPTTWTERENIAWKIETPGSGTSSPIMLGSKIYLTCYSGYNVPGRGRGNMDELKLHLVCLNRADGKLMMPRIRVNEKKTGFVLMPGDTPFVPWGFNYDHDAKGRLIEDYWEAEWPKVETDFRTMKKLGANVVRVHLQLAKFMDSADKPNAKNLDRLTTLLQLAEDVGIYLDLTGLGCYHKADVPAWYDELTEEKRWEVQARFWSSIANRCKASPAVFCYDLMNEPVVPGGPRKNGDWLGGAFGGKHFVQFISLDSQKRPRPDVARKWIQQLSAAIRKEDKDHLITVGLVDWSLDRPGLTSGFVPEKIADDLDFLCVHLYPEKGKVNDALETLKRFQVGKPVVIEETFPLKCSMEEFSEFVEGSKKHASGVIGFYWGESLDELRKSKEFRDAIVLGWLDYFTKHAR